MKIYFNRQPVKGPWGGGNRLLTSLCEEIAREGHEIVYDLDDDVEVIYCIDPRPNNKGVWYQNFLDHKNKFNSRIVQRVGDIGTHSKPELTNLISQTIKLSDFVIFTSAWAKNAMKCKNKNTLVVENAPLDVFYENRSERNHLGDKVRIVTHHWSTNDKKGFDVYSILGHLIENKDPRVKDIDFTYIGRYSQKASSAGINLIDPIDKASLSKKLPEHDIYLTASLEEAGANHVLEAMAAGLPVLYRKNGGSINEYCRGYGLEYDHTVESFLTKLDEMIKNYFILKQSAMTYNRKIQSVVKQYMSVICQA